MEIISQHSKKIMEGCKERAQDFGLIFDSETLEYIVTNQDMLELSPKGMIPTLYDYWVNDLEVIKSKKEYELYPHNPYETVINSRPAISYYNDNNPDWLNIMIFYHVLAHIDFMQNNNYFKHTWSDDFVGQALADKRLLATLRSQHGRWVDYVIEFTRGIDNLTGYYSILSNQVDKKKTKPLSHIDYFFNIFLQKIKNVSTPEYLREIDKLNQYSKHEGCNKQFINKIKSNYPEFETVYKRYVKEFKTKPTDIIQYISENSKFLNTEENKWMKLVIEVVRNTALYFDPQRRTKIINEGWASYWHNKLFIADDRIRSHETDYAKINSYVTSIPKIGVNPYAIGVRLFENIKDNYDKGKTGYDFDKIKDIELRDNYDLSLKKGDESLFYVRSNYCDFTFINSFITQDFMKKYNLVVAGYRINRERMTRQYYIKSKKVEDYKNYLLNSLIHPPHITVNEAKSENGLLYLVHHYEGKQLIKEFIENTMIGINYLWGNEVNLETHFITKQGPQKVIYKSIDKNVELIRV